MVNKMVSLSSNFLLFSYSSWLNYSYSGDYKLFLLETIPPDFGIWVFVFGYSELVLPFLFFFLIPSFTGFPVFFPSFLVDICCVFLVIQFPSDCLSLLIMTQQNMIVYIHVYVCLYIYYIYFILVISFGIPMIYPKEIVCHL